MAKNIVTILIVSGLPFGIALPFLSHDISGTTIVNIFWGFIGSLGFYIKNALDQNSDLSNFCAFIVYPFAAFFGLCFLAKRIDSIESSESRFKPIIISVLFLTYLLSFTSDFIQQSSFLRSIPTFEQYLH
jgi:hypothetical protein